MTSTNDRPERWPQPTTACRVLAGAACLGLALTGASCSSTEGSGSGSSGLNGGSSMSCTPGDADGINGGDYPVLLNVSDTAFTVGGADSGSTEPNIATQNLGDVTLTLTNIGTKPHDMVIECIPSGLPAGCARSSCFPDPADAGSTPGSITLIPTLQPGESKTVTFVTPAIEGGYIFISDEPGDDTHYNSADGGTTGNLVGEFVLM